MARPQVVRFPDADALAEGTAALIERLLGEAIAARGEARIALAGGSTPRAAYRRLRGAAIDWSRVLVFFGDERCVPPDDDKSNYRMAREELLDHVPVPPQNVHRIEGEDAPGEAAARYADVIAGGALDVALLGMGDDGHTASLFPGGRELQSRGAVVVSQSPIPPTARVSLGLSVLDEAGAVVFQICGAGKAARLAEVYAQIVEGRPELPTARVRPTRGTLYWLVDEAAAAGLPAAEENAG